MSRTERRPHPGPSEGGGLSSVQRLQSAPAPLVNAGVDSCDLLFAAPWTVAHQAPPSMGFSRQEYWSGLSCPPPGDLPDPGIEPGSSLQAYSLPAEPPGKLCSAKYHPTDRASVLQQARDSFCAPGAFINVSPMCFCSGWPEPAIKMLGFPGPPSGSDRAHVALDLATTAGRKCAEFRKDAAEWF